MTTATVGLEAIQLLAALGYYGMADGWLEVRAFRGKDEARRVLWCKDANELMAKWSQVVRLNTDGWNVYYGICPRRERGNGKKEGVARIPSLWADLDGKDFAPDWREGKARAIELVTALPDLKQPTVQIDTGHGIQVHWVLREPIPANPQSIARIEAINQALANFLGGDEVHNADRLFRLPGTLNYKPDMGAPVLCTLLADPSDRRFTLADFSELERREVIGTATGGRPGDDYNTNGDWETLLLAHGWKRAGGKGDMSLWCRPGKEAGVSARLNNNGDGRLYVYSSNAGPLQANTGYSLFGAYATLEHGGDFTAAAKALANQGYGGAVVHVNGNGHQGPATRDIVLQREMDDDEDDLPVTVETLAPDLPAAARLSETLGDDTGDWLHMYERYATLVSERTPSIVHQAAGLWLASVAIARRLHVALRHDNIYPNLYLLAVARTTIFSKTTGLSVMINLLEDAMPQLTLSNESTPEALLWELSGKQPPNLDAAEISDRERDLWRDGQRFAAQRGLVLEEASALLAGLRKDYMQGMAELLLRLYDCPPRYRKLTRGGGYQVVRDAYLGICGWTTPARLRTAETDVAWHDGLFARFALLTPEGPGARPSDDPGRRPPRPALLFDDLDRLANSLLPAPERYPATVESRPVAIDDEAVNAQRRYYQALSYDLLTSKAAPDDRLHGTYGRLPAMALKVATLLAALEWSRNDGESELRITLAHYAAAQRIAERWRLSAHRLLDMLTVNTEAEQETTDLDRVLRVLQRQGDGWLTVRDLQRKLGSNRHTISQVGGLVRALEQDGRVEVQERARTPGKAGRPSLVVRFCQYK